MHQGQACISRVATARHHTEKMFYPSFLVIISHNETPALNPSGGGGLDRCSCTMGMTQMKSFLKTLRHLGAIWLGVQHPLREWRLTCCHLRDCNDCRCAQHFQCEAMDWHFGDYCKTLVSGMFAGSAKAPKSSKSFFIWLCSLRIYI